MTPKPSRKKVAKEKTNSKKNLLISDERKLRLGVLHDCFQVTREEIAKAIFDEIEKISVKVKNIGDPVIQWYHITAEDLEQLKKKFGVK